MYPVNSEIIFPAIDSNQAAHSLVVFNVEPANSPAIQVEYIVGHVVGMDTVDRVAHILARGNDHREGEKDHRADAPMQAEH